MFEDFRRLHTPECVRVDSNRNGSGAASIAVGENRNTIQKWIPNPPRLDEHAFPAKQNNRNFALNFEAW